MADAPPKLLALDTSLVLDLAEGLDTAHDFRETFKDRGYVFRLPPTAAVELRWKRLSDPDRAVRTLAPSALADLRTWEVQPLPPCRAGFGVLLRNRWPRSGRRVASTVTLAL